MGAGYQKDQMNSERMDGATMSNLGSDMNFVGADMDGAITRNQSNVSLPKKKKKTLVG